MQYLVNDKLEEALAALVTAALAGQDVSVVTGKAAGDRTLPIVICAAQGSGEEDPPATGNFWVEASVAVRSSVQDTDAVTAKVENQELVSAVFGAFVVEGLAELLTAAAADFTVLPNGVIFGAQESGRDETGVWVDSLSLKVYCCASDLE